MKFVFLLTLLGCQFSWGSDSLLQKVSLPISGKIPNPTVVYGTQEIGFFKASRVSLNSSGKWQAEVIPPSYRHPVQFFLEENGERRKLTSHKFPRPKKHPSDLSLEIRGTFSTPFFQTGLLSEDTSPVSFYPAAFNRNGEIVWYDKSHFRSDRSLKSSTNLSILPWKNGVLQRGAGENSAWNLVGWNGQKTPLQPLTWQGQKLAAHHSMGASESEVFTWAVASQVLSPFRDSIPVFSGIFGWFRAWGEEGRRIVGSRLIALNPETGQTRSIMTSFDLSSPAKDPYRSLDENMDRFLDVTSVDRYRLLRMENDPEIYVTEDYDTDWTHENAIDATPDGRLLVTLRNLNSVVLLSPTGKKIWAIGEESFSTHKWSASQSPLGLPHSARWISENQVVVFDNAAPYRGMRKLPPQSRVLWLKLGDDGSILIEKEVLLPGDKSLTKGSVRPTRDNNFLIWHPGPNTGIGQALETDLKGNILAHMSVQWPWYKKHDEMLPLEHLGDPMVESPQKSKNTIYLESNYDNEVY